jgi:hemoglobin/transferrin/lactoferrin receptor protein
MRRISLVALTMCGFSALHAQQPATDSSNRYVTMNEVVISANKFGEKKKNVAQKIDLLPKQYIAKVNAQNTGDLLISTGNVFVQKSQQGGSSPVLRGFEASRVLLVVDGVRMNNLMYRAGHLQNVITVDQNMLESMEVLYGPASTLYGSDALGGVIHMRTKSPQLSGDKNFMVGGSAFARYSSVNEEKTGHIDVNLGWKKFAWLQSYNYSDIGDMKMGDKYPSGYPNFGRRDSFMTRINGIDTVLKNADDRVQKFSGYKQWDILEKFLFKQSDKVSHTLNLQFSNSTDIPRYDRLQDKRNGTLRYAQWYYGPQKRNLYSYELNAKNLDGFIDELRVNLNYQDIEESRQTREFKRYNQFDSRIEKAKVAGFVIDARRARGNSDLTFGIDGQINDLKSTAFRQDVNSGVKSKIDTRYPDGTNKMNYFGIYAQHSYKMMDGKLVLNEGLRLQSISLKSTLVDTATLFHLPFTSVKQDNIAFTGNIGLVYLPQNNTKLSLVVSSGFRAPNIDDLVKIFESSTSARQLVVPNPDIKPEYTYNIDLGISQLIAGKVKLEVSGFYTWFRNAIVKAPFRLNGQDSVVYYGVKSQVLASQNRNKAYIYGVNASIAADISEHFSASSSINFTRGRFETNAGERSAVYQKQANGTYTVVQAFVSSKPLDHIPPVFGKTSVQYTNKAFQAELFALYNGWKRLDDYNADGEDNAQYATADGSPSWFTINLRSSYRINSHLTVQAAVENLFDRNYRYFGSGFSAPGRNFIVALRAGL